VASLEPQAATEQLDSGLNTPQGMSPLKPFSGPDSLQLFLEQPKALYRAVLLHGEQPLRGGGSGEPHGPQVLPLTFGYCFSKTLLQS